MDESKWSKWGKADAAEMLPLNDSLSVTLQNHEIVTNCKIALTSLSCGNKIIINGVENNNDKRILKMIEKAKSLAQTKNNGGSVLETHGLCIESVNTFPTGAGMASSASGCAAVALCLANLANLSAEDAGVIARIGSGSACRSVFGGFVLWSAGTGLATQIFNRDHWPELKVVMLIHSDVPKHTSSRDGMASSVETSQLMRSRVDCANLRIAAIKDAIARKDFASVATITMQESNQLHAICLDTWPPLFYLNNTSYEIIRFVHLLNGLAKDVLTGYTFDAGPNGFLLVLEQNLPTLMACLYACFDLPITSQESDPCYLTELKLHFPNRSKINRVVVANIGVDPEVLSGNKNFVEMSRAQQARGFEFYPQQPQQQQPPRQLQIQQPALSFQTTAPTLSSSPCNQYVASPRLPAGVGAPQGPAGTNQAASTALYAESSQFADVRRPPQANVPSEVDGMRRELEKSRAQIAQLEKTLKWWSDCTANWREKWSKEKAERRKLKEELAQVRATYDQTLAGELERVKRELEENHRGEEGTGCSELAAKSLQVTTGVGTGDTMQRFGQSLMERSTRGISIPAESTANFELQEVLAETSSALEHERSENSELKLEVERLTAEQTALKTELNLLKETISTIGQPKENCGQNGSLEMVLHGLPKSVNELIENLQSKVEKLEKDIVSRQMEHINDWSIIDRLESDRTLLQAENERLSVKLQESEDIVNRNSESCDGIGTDDVKTKELESLRADVHCLRRLVNRQTQELDHVNFLLSNQETETKLLRSRLLQPWGVSAQRSANTTATSNGASQSS